jgi:multiple sugar transport system permease protein
LSGPSSSSYGVRPSDAERVAAALHLESDNSPAAATVPAVRALPLLPHGPDLAETGPRALRPARVAAFDQPGADARPLQPPRDGDRLPHLLVTVLATSLSVVLGTIAAYALARLKFFGVATFGTGIFVTYLVPTSLLFLPLAQVVNSLGLGDSKWALVVTYPTFLVPFCTWLLMGYFRTVPKEVEECAMVDGATRLQALLRIVLPIAVPGLVCAILFAFTLSWNEFIYALTFTSSSSEITASVGVTSELIRGDIYFWGSLMAGAVLGSVPIVVLYVFFLDYYVSGLTAGAVK